MPTGAPAPKLKVSHTTTEAFLLSPTLFAPACVSASRKGYEENAFVPPHLHAWMRGCAVQKNQCSTQYNLSLDVPRPLPSSAQNNYRSALFSYIPIPTSLVSLTRPTPLLRAFRFLSAPTRPLSCRYLRSIYTSRQAGLTPSPSGCHLSSPRCKTQSASVHRVAWPSPSPLRFPPPGVPVARSAWHSECRGKRFNLYGHIAIQRV